MKFFLISQVVQNREERSVPMKVGLDIGSTTIKCVVLNDKNQIIYKTYDRHLSKVTEKTAELLASLDQNILMGKETLFTISGSAGMGLAEACGVPFLQEVYSTRSAAARLIPNADVIIELGGEDAKILFLTGGTEVRMNGSCAGGTGSFIDQMASLMHVSPEDLNTLAERSERSYPIASRCGVFAKSDVQPLLNQGAHKEDIAKSILNAVAQQTIAGLAQGRRITGNVYYLGGPLTFLPELRQSFDKMLEHPGICPKDSLYFVALGAAFLSDEAGRMRAEELSAKLLSAVGTESRKTLPSLFNDQTDYDAFSARHARAAITSGTIESSKELFLGIDAGSTTIKAALINEKAELVASLYQENRGTPVAIIKDFLLTLYRNRPGLSIRAGASTGYGEDLLKNAFQLDFGVVETVAHLTAAKKFMPEVDFVIDIGGQDIKCFRIIDGNIDNIFLNEACSSGCGSFLQTFAAATGHSIEEFARLGIFADRPVDLGSRCTVFMNSSIKQAQKDGATIENIAAGLSISVVKNALYKVIRAASKEELGRHIVVQGGTFLNDTVLRAFEREMDCEVVRPNLSGLMGAFGAALYARAHARRAKGGILTEDLLESFVHEEKNVPCVGCGNRCTLVINTFSGGGRFVSGNKCERYSADSRSDDLNLYEYKRELLDAYCKQAHGGNKGRIGLPFGLNNYDLLPLWHTFFAALGYTPVVSDVSNPGTYAKGQFSIPSDTACFPAKLLHGHIEQLLEIGVDAIFYPCITYNFDEGLGDNHFNCPVVAYYPEVIRANMDLSDIPLIMDYMMPEPAAQFTTRMTKAMRQLNPKIHRHSVQKALDAAFAEYAAYRKAICQKAEEIIRAARAQGKRIFVLAGRPYHVDPEICHGIDRLITSLGTAVITEDALSAEAAKVPTDVLNQWTYHARMYAAANYVLTQPDMELIQLVSFGCGVDAVTSDEVREILHSGGKLYTQLKIDEITNLGAIKIRLRSLHAAIDEREGEPI